MKTNRIIIVCISVCTKQFVQSSFKISIAILVCVIMPTACSKSGPSGVRGYTYDKTTNARVPHAAVALFGRHGEIFNTNPWTLIAQGQSDVSGNYYLSFNAQKGYDYEMAASKDGFIYDPTLNNTNVTGNSHNKNTNLPMQPAGILKLRVKDSLPYNNSDLIDVYLGGYYRFYGSHTDTSILVVCNGNSVFALNTGCRKNGIFTFYTYNIFIKEHDTTNYNLNY